MLIWLNGAHGAGKTSVARQILKLRPDARLFDPERIGFLLRRIWPGAVPDDFKDLPAWRSMTLAALRALAAGPEGGSVIVPMTLSDPRHFTEIVGTLRAEGHEVRHFTLAASPATLRKRLWRRLDWPASRRWAIARSEGVAAALADPLFGVHLDTEQASVPALAAAVLRP